MDAREVRLPLVCAADGGRFEILAPSGGSMDNLTLQQTQDKELNELRDNRELCDSAIDQTSGIIGALFAIAEEVMKLRHHLEYRD